MRGLNLSVTDPNSTSIKLNFPGNSIHRVSQITYANGFYVDPAGYEGVWSFEIATTDVTNSVLNYCRINRVFIRG